jgi:hypothetical protein
MMSPLLKCRVIFRQAMRAFALDPHDRPVERRQELRAITRRKWLRSAGDFAGAAQLVQQIAGGERHADRILVEGFTVRRNHGGTGLDAAARQRHIGGDDNVARAGAPGDPVVGGIHAGAYHHALNPRLARHRDRAIGDHIDLQPVSLSDAVDLRLHRAGVGVHVDFDRLGHVRLVLTLVIPR